MDTEIVARSDHPHRVRRAQGGRRTIRGKDAELIQTDLSNDEETRLREAFAD